MASPHIHSAPNRGVYLDQSIFGLVVGWEVFTGNTQCTMARLGGMQEEIAPSGQDLDSYTSTT
jgi:hypothetical protein